ncbi:MAG: hypothetical protein AAF804_02040 [Bacteroidota bacterium]
MNFDELKTLWRAEQAQHSDHSAAEIRSMLFQRSHSALSFINRNIKIEGSLVALALFYSLYAAWDQSSVARYFWMFMALFSTASLAFYIYKYRQLNEISLSASDLKSTLRHTADTMSGYMRFYFYATTILIPILAFSSMFYGYAIGAWQDGRTLRDLAWTEYLILGGIGLIYMAFSYIATKWYIDRLYGRHFRELKACLAELEEGLGDTEESPEF